MGRVPPPCPILRKEFNERWKKGARTLAEIDPELFKYVYRGVRSLFYTSKSVTSLYKRLK